MNSFFYLKLAVSNLKKNAKTYIPYLLTCIVTTAMFYIIKALAINEGLESMIGGAEMKMLLGFGVIVIGLFSVIFLFYTNSFLIKQRKKEFGLFNILGMEKKHILRLIVCESLITFGISLFLGLLIGVSMDKIMFLLIANMLNAKITLGFSISAVAIKTTMIVFGMIQLLICLNSIREISISNPIELLHSAASGEKEPKVKWVLFLLGLLFLGSGYYISITTINPLGAFGLFFFAVICVMIGTYLLFTAGSIALLKILQKRKNFYYQINHFISISGMIYRMKQNAVGLANICILSTMVLVTLSTTISMWVSIEDLVVTRYPREIVIGYTSDDFHVRNQIQDEVAAFMKQQEVDIENPMVYTYLSFSVLYQDGQYITDRSGWEIDKINSAYNLFFMTLDEYNQNCHAKEKLDDHEILIYTDRTEFDESKVSLFNETYDVKKKLDSFVENGFMMSNIAATHYIVVKDQEALYDIAQKQKEAYGDMASEIKHYIAFDTDANSDKNSALYESLSKELAHYKGIDIESRSDSFQGFSALYSGLMFLGLFLSVLFVMATILIIYYKQITEGYEDKGRYEIMQKVGMDHQTVKKSINSQVLMIFFLPLVVASIHTAFAFPIVSRLLKVLMFDNINLLIICTICCIGMFSVAYILVYILTSKFYYQIVKRNEG